MKTNTSMKNYYAARANEYDDVYAKPERQADLRVIEDWISCIFSGKHVLEVACGTGYWTQFFAPQASSVVATDATQKTLDIARSRAGMKNVHFSIADAYALPKELGLFDAAFAGFWLSHVPRERLRTFLDGLHTRLKPGALVLFLDNLYVEGSSTPISERDEDGNTYQIRKLRDETTHRVLKNFPSESGLMKMVDSSGTNAHFRAFKYYWAFSYEVNSV